MQTFLPYSSFRKSAECLDNKRLGKQRVEAYQILRTLTGKSTGWVNHPAVKMWRGYETTLAAYGHCCCTEWISRGYKDTLRPVFDSMRWPFKADPDWITDVRVHESHRSNLLRKMPLWYSRFGWNAPNDLPYYWPVR